MRRGEPVAAYCPSLNNSATLLVKGSCERRQREPAASCSMDACWSLSPRRRLMGAHWLCGTDEPERGGGLRGATVRSKWRHQSKDGRRFQHFFSRMGERGPAGPRRPPANLCTAKRTFH